MNMNLFSKDDLGIGSDGLINAIRNGGAMQSAILSICGNQDPSTNAALGLFILLFLEQRVETVGWINRLNREKGICLGKVAYGFSGAYHRGYHNGRVESLFSRDTFYAKLLGSFSEEDLEGLEGSDRWNNLSRYVRIPTLGKRCRGLLIECLLATQRFEDGPGRVEHIRKLISEDQGGALLFFANICRENHPDCESTAYADQLGIESMNWRTK